MACHEDLAVPPARRKTAAQPDINWEEEAKAILKAEMKHRRLGYADLAERFGQMGFPITEPTLRNKFSRGSFSASFFLQCLAALDCRTLHLKIDEETR